RLEYAVTQGDLPHVTLHTWQMVEIMMFPIPERQPHEYAKDTQIALQAHPLIGAMQRSEIIPHWQAASAGGLPIPDGPIQLLFCLRRMARVGDLGSDFVGDRPRYGVLKINASGFVALLTRHRQVGRVVVTMN